MASSDSYKPVPIAQSCQSPSSEAINLFHQGLQLHQTGDIETAKSLYQSAIALSPRFPQATQYLGVIAAQQGDFKLSIELISRSITLNPLDSSAYLNRGLAYSALNKFDLALQDFKYAREITPSYAEALFNEGNALQSLKRFSDAVVAYKNTISLAPNFALAYNNLGNAQQELKQFSEALKSYEKAIEINPDYAEAYFNCGTLFQAIKQYRTAIQFFDRCLEIDPHCIEAYIYNGDTYDELVNTEKANHCYEQALSINPNSLEARFAKALSQIPKIYSIDSDPQHHRNNLIQEIFALDSWIGSRSINNGYKVVGSHQPFFLAYQEQNNVEILAKYGDICSRLMSELQPSKKFRTNLPNKKVSVGIVSGHIYSHSVWNAITKGWIENLDSKNFDIHLFHLGEINDTETVRAKSHAASYTQGNLPIEQWINIVEGKNLDILIYPEIGMDRLTCQLANLRLAPKQIATWGHPETTGLPTIDYYISADNFETESSQENYTEKLITLPNLGCFYLPYEGTIQSVDPTELGLDPLRPILLCPGTPFKYAPQFDYVLVEIAKQIKNAQLVFFDFPDMPVDILKERLSIQFKRHGLKLENHVVYIPKLTTEKFYGLMKVSDVFIDTIGFSGFNTAIQAIECNLPVATYRGKFMRGKLASGILMRMGLNQLISNSLDDFVSNIVRLATEKQFRDSISEKIQSSKEVLFKDLAPINKLNQFLLDITKS